MKSYNLVIILIFQEFKTDKKRAGKFPANHTDLNMYVLIADIVYRIADLWFDFFFRFFKKPAYNSSFVVVYA